jgi:hypothetical protein
MRRFFTHSALCLCIASKAMAQDAHVDWYSSQLTPASTSASAKLLQALTTGRLETGGLVTQLQVYADADDAGLAYVQVGLEFKLPFGR